MDNANSNLISTVTVRIRANNLSGTTIGTGILYYEDTLYDKVYILTAAHCLFKDRVSFQQKFDSICVDIYSPQERTYKSITVENVNENLLNKVEVEDVAIIIIDKEKIDSVNPFVPKIQAIKERKSFYSFITKGFPNATKGKELVAVSSTWLHEMTETNRFQLQLNADYTETNVVGFSGAGIFLEANNEIYLYGIFTRFREEEKGKVIYCQYVDSINKLLRENFLPLINYSFLVEKGLTPSFFTNKIDCEIKNLGPRFNEELNFELPIARIFDSISKNAIYIQNIITKTDKWLTEKGYRKLKDSELLAEIEIELETLRQEIKDWLIKFNNHLVKAGITLLPLVEKVENFNKKVSDKWRELFDLSLLEKEAKDKSKKTFDSELSRLREIQDANRKFIEDIDNLNIILANHPTLIIKGEAGCGKSHLLGDIAMQRKNLNLPTILLLGTTFSITTIEQNILKKLDLTCSFKEFLENLNSIGLQINSRVLILIDAINEGAGVDLWKNQIAGFIDTLAKYPAIGLVMTIRSTYFYDIIPHNFESNPNITIITHEGFKGNEYAALKLFCNHYNLKLPNFPILNHEFANPLFLLIICESVKDLPEKSFPKGFNGVNKTYSLYKQFLNRKFEEKRHEYKYQDIASKVIEKLAVELFNAEYNSLKIPDALKFFNSEFPQFPLLFPDLIEESVLIKMRPEYDRGNSEDIVFFSYQRLGDFFMAEELLKPYLTKEELKKAFENEPNFQKIVDDYQWSQRGVVEALVILLPERYNLELFELISLFLDKNTDEQHKEYYEAHTYESFTQILLDSLKWREISSIIDEKITDWLQEKGKLSDDEWLYTLTELAAIPNHPFNGDILHKILFRRSMSERDSFWQNYIRFYCGYDENMIAFPLQRLIDWAWSSNISYNIDSETARLVAQTLAWVLSSTDIALRDKTTKALVNLLEQQPEALIKTLTAFEDIDDLYILDRLYAVAYGCILRTEKNDSIKTIAQYVFDTIFKNGNPPIHILIRDYARNIIEYGNCKNVGLNINVKLIRPPYNSKMPKIPTEEEIEKYKIDYDSPSFKENYGRQQNQIINSVTSSVNDFKKYEIDSKLSHFNHISYRIEKNYKIYLKSLNYKQRDLIKFLDLLFKVKEKEIEIKDVFRYQILNQDESELNSLLEKNEKDIQDYDIRINELFNLEERQYLYDEIIPFIKEKNKPNIRKQFNTKPIERWIIKQVFNLGYNKDIHGEYDYMAERWGGYGREYKIRRIGEKYQWIAWYEILARLTDNYKIDADMNGKYTFYKGAWQNYLRDIDPAYITKNKDDDENDETHIKQSNKEWWSDVEYTHWNYLDSEWVKTTEDLISPKQVIEKKDINGGEWLHLQHYIEWLEPKKIGIERYEGRIKKISYHIQGLLINKSDKREIIDYLKNKNLWGDRFPRNRDDYSNLINREKFWSPAYLDVYNNDKKIWKTIKSTKYKIIVATESANGGIEGDKSGANHSYNIPCKYIFEGMKLQYALIDGNLKNTDDDTIVINSNREGVLIRKKDLVQFLEGNGLDIIWTLLGEKMSYDSGQRQDSYFVVPCGVYYLDNGKLVGELKMYDRD